MTKKKKKIIVGISFIVFSFLFLYYFSQVVSFVFHPANFNFFQLLMAIFLLFVVLIHVAFFINLIAVKDKVRTVDDIDQWWTKWDME